METFQHVDILYGPVEIDEPVIIALLQSHALRRLQGVLQHGITGLIGITNQTTRFDHSVGVFLLVRRLGGSLEEQIAALLHDVSHTAFSHVIDYVFGGHTTQSFHDQHKETYVAGTDLPAILASFGYDWCKFVCLEDAEMTSAYPLLEQPAPALCADRLDYFLRDSLGLGLADQAHVDQVLDRLEVYQDKIVVRDLETARWMAETYLAADQKSWANFREVGLYELAARALRRALEIGALEKNDLWGTDRAIWTYLHTIADSELQQALGLVHPDTRFEWDGVSPTFQVRTKLRTIDPEVLTNGRTRLLSDLDPEFAGRRAQYLQRNGGIWPMRVIPFE